MRAVVGYESMFGNTRQVAEAIADGLADSCDVTTVPVAGLERELAVDADLLVVGGPTHVWTMSRPNTRKAARQQVDGARGALVLEPGADGIGLREWFAATHAEPAVAAAFTTRLDASEIFTGSAAPRIARQLRRRSWSLAVAPESFLVTKQNALLPGELDRARKWGRTVAASAQRARTP